MRDCAQALIEKEQFASIVAIEQAMNQILNEQSRIISIPKTIYPNHS